VTATENNKPVVVRQNSAHLIAAHSRRAAGWARQAPRRRNESSARCRAACLCDELAARGCRHEAIAQRLCVPRRTLSRWRQACHRQDPCQPRGRPCKQSSPSQRREVLDWLDHEGCHLGSPALRAAFPSLPRCELLELQRLWRMAYRAAHRVTMPRLTWYQPGSVWAMDHTHPPEPIDGIYPSILCIRDLASGMQLAWQPVPDETAGTTITVVESLFAAHGPPLVVKSYNGAAFKDHGFAELLERHHVVPLPSPPRTPRYNGSCEVTNRHSKNRTQHFAQRNSHGRWTTTAVEAARRQANELLHPNGHLAPTASQRWTARSPISDQQRNALAQSIAAQNQQLQRLTNLKKTLTLNDQRRLFRAAVRRALLDLGLLSINPRSITPPFILKKRAKIC
jgi:transposase InsO family protein